MSLTAVRYQESVRTPLEQIAVDSPHDAVLLLRRWQRAYPEQSGALLDERRRTVATAGHHAPDRRLE